MCVRCGIYTYTYIIVLYTRADLARDRDFSYAHEIRKFFVFLKKRFGPPYHTRRGLDHRAVFTVIRAFRDRLRLAMVILYYYMYYYFRYLPLSDRPSVYHRPVSVYRGAVGPREREYSHIVVLRLCDA